MNIDAFFKLSYGLYIVASKNNEGAMTGHVNNTSFQITADPPQFAVSTNKDNLTTKYIRESGYFSINILHDKVQKELINLFGFKSGTEVKKFAETNFESGVSGVPIVQQDVMAFIECKVVQAIEIDTHILFIGKAINANVLNPEATPITYQRYRDEIKGRAPKNAPTFQSKKLKEKLEQELGAELQLESKPQKVQKWVCTTCGWEYDPEVGDPDGGILPGTAFEDIPDDWVCPDCGAMKADFEPLD